MDGFNGRLDLAEEIKLKDKLEKKCFQGKTEN